MKNKHFEEELKSEESPLWKDPWEWDCWSLSAKVEGITSDSNQSDSSHEVFEEVKR